MPQARIRARVIYFARIGFYALDVSEPLMTRLSYTEAYFECFTGRDLDPGESDVFKRQIIKKYAGGLP